MIGNDIVSLDVVRKAPKSGSARFLGKVLHASEYALLARHPDRECALWMLWALKESAYKLAFRQSGRRFFGPKQFVCTGLEADPATGAFGAQVRTSGAVYPASGYAGPAFIHALAAVSAAVLDATQWGVFELARQEPAYQSLAVRTVACAAMGHILPEKQAFHISAPGALPYPIVSGPDGGAGPALSLSHHGCLAAYAFTVSVDL
mgnify:CR=1 FL=1